MNEKAYRLHYSTLARPLEDNMWVIDSGASRHMTGDQVRLSNLNKKKTSHKVELERRTPIQSKELVKPPSDWNQVTMFI
jgi:hypothetical protein